MRSSVISSGRMPSSRSRLTAARSVDDLCATAVVQRDRQDHAFVSNGLFGSARDLFANVFSQRSGSADSLKLDVLAIDLVELDPDVAAQHAHQRVDLVTGALPILCRERVQRQRG